jgi:hypothetical protein
MYELLLYRSSSVRQNITFLVKLSSSIRLVILNSYSLSVWLSLWPQLLSPQCEIITVTSYSLFSVYHHDHSYSLHSLWLSPCTIVTVSSVCDYQNDHKLRGGSLRFVLGAFKWLFFFQMMCEVLCWWCVICKIVFLDFVHCLNYK